MDIFKGFSEITKKIFLEIKENRNISRVEIARKLDVSEATVSRHVKKLMNSGLIVQSGTAVSSGGRKPVELTINPKAYRILAVHVAYEKLKFVLFDPLENDIFKREIEIERNIDFNKIIGIVMRTILSEKMERILGIGFALPAPLDYAKKKLVYSRFYGWEDVKLLDYFDIGKEKVSVFWENDANLSAMGYHRITKLNNIVSVYLDKGIGVGIVKDGKIHRGSNGQAGEIGQILVRKDGEGMEELERFVIEKSHENSTLKQVREILSFTLTVVLKTIDPDVLTFNGEIPMKNKNMMNMIIDEIRARLKGKAYPIRIYDGNGIDPIFLGIQQMVFMNMIEMY